MSVHPAEYSKNPVNMSREEWEFEQSFNDLIYWDDKLCVAYAGGGSFPVSNEKDWIQIKSGAYLSEKVSGRKMYHKLDKMDEMWNMQIII